MRRRGYSSPGLLPDGAALSLVALLLVVGILVLLVATVDKVARVQADAARVIVCEAGAWVPLVEPLAFPADVEQVCHVGTVDGAPVRVVVLD